MSLAGFFIGRPVATTLLSAGLALLGLAAFPLMPVAPLPDVDLPTIMVSAAMPGANPETMATSVAGPLEKHLGQIASLTEMTSISSLGSTRVILQFDLDRAVDGAARDVEAAINAARADLPTSLRANPTYRKLNPADAPLMVLALTSPTLTQGQLYDVGATFLQQPLSQVQGIGQVELGGSALSAVRVELQPRSLFKYGIGLEDIRAALASANAHAPKGAVEQGPRRYQIYTNDQADHAADYRPLIVAYRKGAPVALSDVGSVVDSVEDLRNAGIANGKPAVLVVLYRQPGANLVATVDRVRALLSSLRAGLPGAVDLEAITDRTGTIRASLHETEVTLGLAVVLVTLVVFVFLGSARATLIPSVAVPISLIATVAPMYLLGYSLDTLSLMALVVATGFVVDDAIVVLENIARGIEAGLPRREAAVRGLREVAPTVISISLSLIAVFLPILLMGGLVGRFMREFGVTLSIAVLVSLVVSLTTTPMLCALLLQPEPKGEARPPGALARLSAAILALYATTLRGALAHRGLVLLSLAATVGLNVYLYAVIPKGFVPETDTGRLMGGIQGDQSISFTAMKGKLDQFARIILADPAVQGLAGFTGGQKTNSGFLFVQLKPMAERRVSTGEVMTRLRRQFGEVTGARLFLQAVQDFRAGGRASSAQYQYTLLGDSAPELKQWTDRLIERMRSERDLTDVNSDQEETGLAVDIAYDRASLARFGLTPNAVDNTLYDAFGQRQVSTIYAPLNQYHVVMEVAPEYWQSPSLLDELMVSTSGGPASATASTGALAGTVSGPRSAAPSATALAADSVRNRANNAIAASGRGGASSGSPVSLAAETMVPLSAFATFAQGHTPLAVNHQNMLVASTLSFNLRPGASLSDADAAIRRAIEDIRLPASIQGRFAGTAAVFKSSLDNELLVIAAAFIAVYMVLGILYESTIHPITIISTLPSAGVGALLALLVCQTEFSLIAVIGVILLIGVVKKNAILMIDFALQAERRGAAPVDAITEACLLRFRPIMMTTFAAILGALPLCFGMGEGAELRQPLGISIVGGLIVSQVLTLYTTPVVYLALDRLRGRRRSRVATGSAGLSPQAAE